MEGEATQEGERRLPHRRSIHDFYHLFSRPRFFLTECTGCDDHTGSPAPKWPGHIPIDTTPSGSDSREVFSPANQLKTEQPRGPVGGGQWG